MEIQRGTRVLVKTAFDEEVERRALGPIEAGIDFPVVWVCTEAEWSEAEHGSSSPEGDPWPAEAVALIKDGVPA